MYRPQKYKKDDKDFILSFIKKNPFASFIMNGERLIATHIPVLVEEDAKGWRLYSHMANHNEQAASLKDGAEALIIFHGPHSYVSSSWYKEKDISTWDYTAVHVNARISLQSAVELEESLKELVRYFEKDQEAPLFYDQIPRPMLDAHLPLITGFWLEPYKVEGIAKLHQSYGKEDVHSVISHLEKDSSMGKELSQQIKKEHEME